MAEGKIDWFSKLISVLTIGGLIAAGIAWGQATRQIEINTVRLNSLEVRVIKLENLAERVDQQLIENKEAHTRIEAKIDKIGNYIVKDTK